MSSTAMISAPMVASELGRKPAVDCTGITVSVPSISLRSVVRIRLLATRSCSSVAIAPGKMGIGVAMLPHCALRRVCNRSLGGGRLHRVHVIHPVQLHNRCLKVLRLGG